MKNQVSAIAPTQPVSPLSVAYSNDQVSIKPALDISGHITAPADFYEKFKDAEVFQKGYPRAEFFHQTNTIVLMAGEGESQVQVTGMLKESRLYSDLKVDQKVWMPADEIRDYFSKHSEYFSAHEKNKRYFYEDMDDFLRVKELAEQDKGEDFVFDLCLFEGIKGDPDNFDDRVWLEIHMRPGLGLVPMVSFSSALKTSYMSMLKEKIFAQQKERLKGLLCIDVY